MSRARDLAGIFNLNPLSGTTAQRPTTAEVGDIYYNGTIGKTQIYTTTGWQDMASGITYGNNSGRPANPAVGTPYFNGEEKRLELYTSSGWQNIVSETPGVVSISGSYLESSATNSFDITGTNFSTGALASAIGTNGVEVNANSTTVNSIVSVTAVFSGLSAAYEPYDIKVTNTSNLFGLLPEALYINQSPIWQTPSGSLGSFNEQVSITLSALSATDPESTPITYSLASGSTLPSGVTLNSSNGVISGTLPNISSTTVYTFTINASDGSNTVVPRAFSITSNALPEVSGGTLATGSTYYYRVFTADGSLSVSTGTVTADVLVIAGGGGGGSGWYAGGGGAGGVKLYSGLTLSPSSYPVAVGNGGTGSTNTAVAGSNGQNSSFNTSNSATGGGGGGSRQQNVSGQRYGGNGGSGGGTAWPNTLGGTGISGQGFDGGSNTNGGYGSSGGGAGSAGTHGGNPIYGNVGGSGTNTYSSWLSEISSIMSGVSGWSTATSTGYIAGGGAGGSDSSTNWLGGVGGGGRSSAGGSVSATNGVTNTGGGGGGGSNSESANPATGPVKGADGGSGLVIVRYLKNSVSA
jgi:hypothetical protein